MPAAAVLSNRTGCTLCPRRCGHERTAADPGFCGAAEPYPACRVASLMVHHWEEPCISGRNGSGTVFFSGCALRCCFCQNHEISLSGQGRCFTLTQLAAAILDLSAKGVHNLNLVTASHYADRIPELLQRLKASQEWQARPLPVIWNSSGYETEEMIDLLQGLVDIFLPDFKYFDSSLSRDLSGAADYCGVAGRAILAMWRQQPNTVFDAEGMLQKGLLIRHLVLPGHWQDSCRILDFLADRLPLSTPLSLMCQYTPQPVLPLPAAYPELSRTLTTLEYKKVLDYALDRGFTRIFGQERSSANVAYTPDFASVDSGSAF